MTADTSGESRSGRRPALLHSTKIDFPEPGAPNSAPASNSQRTQGLDVTKLSPPIAVGEVFFLDIPF
jgi:hypothetical protein